MSIHRCEYDSQDRIRLTCCLVAAGLLLSAVAAVRAEDPGCSTTTTTHNVAVHVTTDGNHADPAREIAAATNPVWAP